MTRIEEIYAEVLPMLMESNGIEDTPQNRLSALEGLRDAWKEDNDDSIEKTLYMVALNAEIFALHIKVMWPQYSK